MEFKAYITLLHVLGKAKKFLEKWMIELMKRVDKTTKESNKKMLDQLNEIRMMINNSNAPEDSGMSMNESFDKIEKLFKV